TSCFLVAQSASDVIGLISAERVPYFPNGSTICRVTGLVVSSQHRGQGIGEKLLAGAADFAREPQCSGIEITRAEHRLEAHRFYQRLGLCRPSFRFFRAGTAIELSRTRSPFLRAMIRKPSCLIS